MRLWIAALAAACLLAGPAAAQKSEPAPAPPALTPIAPGDAPAPIAAPASAAAVGVARTFLIDSGLITAAFDAAIAERFGNARTQFARELRGMTRARREAALAAFDNMPTILREEVDVRMPALVNAFAGELDREFEAAHIAEIDAFLRTPGGRALIREGLNVGLRAGVRGEEVSQTDSTNALRAVMAGLSDEEAGATMRFVTSEAGVAFSTRMGAMRERLQRSMTAALLPALGASMVRIQADLCAALGPECPREMRPSRSNTP